MGWVSGNPDSEGKVAIAIFQLFSDTSASLSRVFGLFLKVQGFWLLRG